MWKDARTALEEAGIAVAAPGQKRSAEDGYCTVSSAGFSRDVNMLEVTVCVPVEKYSALEELSGRVCKILDKVFYRKSISADKINEKLGIYTRAVMYADRESLDTGELDLDLAAAGIQIGNEIRLFNSAEKAAVIPIYAEGKKQELWVGNELKDINYTGKVLIGYDITLKGVCIPLKMLADYFGLVDENRFAAPSSQIMTKLYLFTKKGNRKFCFNKCTLGKYEAAFGETLHGDFIFECRAEPKNIVINIEEYTDEELALQNTSAGGDNNG